MLRILLVDDNVDTTSSLSYLLSLWGHDVLVANNGVAALDLAASYGPDVILLDVAMPGMNGYEVAQRLRRMPGAREALVVAMTGLFGEAFHREAGKVGFDIFLPKPIWPDELKQLLGCCVPRTRYLVTS